MSLAERWTHKALALRCAYDVFVEQANEFAPRYEALRSVWLPHGDIRKNRLTV